MGHLAWIIVLLMLTSCGLKGDLYMPPPESTAPEAPGPVQPDKEKEDQDNATAKPAPTGQ